jgi:hypothetical protein
LHGNQSWGFKKSPIMSMKTLIFVLNEWECHDLIQVCDQFLGGASVLPKTKEVECFQEESN